MSTSVITMSPPHDAPATIEEALLSRDALYRNIIASAADGFFTVDARYRFLDVNQAFCTLFGCPRETFIGRSPLDFVTPASRPELTRQIGRVATTQRRVYELEGLRPDGSTFPALISTVTHRNVRDEIVGTLGFITDLGPAYAARARVAQSEAELRAVLDNLQDTYYRTDADGCLVRVSPSVRKLLGYDAEELIGTPIARLYTRPTERDVFLQTLEDAGGAVEHYEASLRHKDGHEVWVATSAHLYRNPDDDTVGVEGTTRDISRERAQRVQLQLAATVLAATREAIMITDHDNRIISVNPAFTQLTGYQPEEVIGQGPQLLSAQRHSIAFYSQLWDALAGDDHWSGEVWNRRKNGNYFPQWLSLSAVRDPAGKLLHYVAIFSDLSDRKAAEARIEFLAHHDALTCLPNRLLLKERAQQCFVQAERNRAKPALLFLDLDRFKDIIDSLGHPIGDRLLQAVAERLRSATRESDLVGRLGGDEFLVLLNGIRDTEDIAPVVEKIMQALAEPYHADGHELLCTCSVGLAVFPDDGTDFDTLAKHADAAMYEAKAAGRATFRFYSQRMNEDALARLDLQKGLRRGLERNEFILHYQPLVDLADNRIIGAEALLRWQPPDRPLVPPGHFIPVAEDSGLIVPIGAWVLREAFTQARAWQDAGHQLVMAINLSPLQITRGDLVDTVRALLADTGADPHRIELEITESVLLHDTEQVLAVVRQLRQMGLRLSIDDFGSGYSSLAYLRRFAVEKLKIDQCFIRDLPTDPEDGAIVRAVIQMAKSLKMTVLAEGVESADIAHDLRLLGCDLAQGYHFGRPMPAQAFLDLLGA
ncbi:MAG TPA: EAL domain-containing protein [Rhodocyclaceae bacterium]|nr:EAL domain-containing protein [Rhodocyclaceae bacterium]HMZ76698.1 EAL domain-containing protein [Rhodocyclaceae bacterium]HNC80664.1 EAL domain-containing protein [Rhodocyclaceae bacterium]